MTSPALNHGITLGVDLATSRGCLRITFQPGDERAFVVGGSPHADLRLRNPGVGGVAFHLERRQDHVELFPADTTREIFVNGCRVLGPVVLEPSSVVDLPGERLVLTTFDATGHEAASSVRLAEAGIAYVAALPSESATTLCGFESDSPESDDAIYEMKTTAFRPEHAEDVHKKQTTAFTPVRAPELDRTVSFDGRRTDRLAPHDLARTLPLGPTGTEVVRRSDLFSPAMAVQIVTDKIPRDQLYSPAPAPVGNAPAVTAPVVNAPAVTAPVVNAPAVTAPVVTAPVVNAPSVTAPVVNAPAVNAPVAPPLVPAPVVVASAARSMPPAVPPPAEPTFAPESRGPATTRFDHPVPHPAAQPAPLAPPAATLGTDTTALDVRKLGLTSKPPALPRSSPPPSTWASDNPTVMSVAPRGQRLRVALRRWARALGQGRRKSPGELVVALGVLARKRPLAVSLGAVAGACALSLALTGAAKLAGYGKARPARPVAAATAKPKPAPAPPAAPVPAVVPSMVIRSAPPPPATSASARPRARTTPFDAEVATAAADLAAGRDAQARAGYTRLATRSPENPAYESLATLLARAASPECEKPQPGAEASCPEVKR